MPRAYFASTAVGGPALVRAPQQVADAPNEVDHLAVRLRVHSTLRPWRWCCLAATPLLGVLPPENVGAAFAAKWYSYRLRTAPAISQRRVL